MVKSILIVCILVQSAFLLYGMIGEDGCCASAKRCQDAAETRFDDIKKECEKTNKYAIQCCDDADKWRDLTVKCMAMRADQKR